MPAADGPGEFRPSDTGVRTGHRTAKQQQARVFWLRAAISLSRALAARGGPENSVAQLQEVVLAFSGDDEPEELATARQILSESFI
jgi:hypothetical protein